MDLWTDILAIGGTVDAVYLDIAKAFDTVPHQRLQIKQEGYGVKGKLLEWFKDFLLGRRQRKVVAGSFSEWRQVLSGIPQGPVMFICYINDLPDDIASFIFLYAEDRQDKTTIVDGRRQGLYVCIIIPVKISKNFKKRCNKHKLRFPVPVKSASQ